MCLARIVPIVCAFKYDILVSAKYKCASFTSVDATMLNLAFIECLPQGLNIEAKVKEVRR